MTTYEPYSSYRAWMQTVRDTVTEQGYVALARIMGELREFRPSVASRVALPLMRPIGTDREEESAEAIPPSWRQPSSR